MKTEVNLNTESKIKNKNYYCKFAEYFNKQELNSNVELLNNSFNNTK